MNTDKKIIFLPDTESAAKLIEQSWQAFKKEAEENGLAISGADTEAFIKVVPKQPNRILRIIRLFLFIIKRKISNIK